MTNGQLAENTGRLGETSGCETQLRSHWVLDRSSGRPVPSLTWQTLVSRRETPSVPTRRKLPPCQVRQDRLHGRWQIDRSTGRPALCFTRLLADTTADTRDVRAA